MTNISRPCCIRDLCRLELHGDLPEFLFFWGHQQRRNGSIGTACMSQWWPAPFTVDELTYRTAEHFMMVSKARLFGDESAASRILAAESPREAKALGRAVRGFDEEVWKASRYRVVVDGNTAKFAQNPELLLYLTSTTGRVLVEASPEDQIWGIGLAADNNRSRRPSQWRGLNLLGFALMDVREKLTSARQAY